MSSSRLLGLVTAAIVAPLLGNFASTAQAELVYGLSDANTLFRFDSATPGTQTSIGTFSGLVAGQTLKTMDFRPATGELYAISSNGLACQVYTVNLTTAALTAVGAGFSYTGSSSTRLSMDFNPTVDRIRFVTGNGQNLRLNPITGLIAATDTTLAFDAADINAGTTPLVSGVAYTNNVAGATSTTLYALDYITDNLTTIGSVGSAPVSPNAGTMFTVGDVGVITGTAGSGFDISGATGLGYVNTDTSGANDEFYRVNLSTGLLSLVGTLGRPVLDISVAVVPEPTSLAMLALGGVAMIRRRRQA